MYTLKARHVLASLGLAAGLAACGGGNNESAAHDSAAAATMPADSAGLQTTPPQPTGPMNMVDSSARAPLVADSPPGTVRTDSAPRRP